MPESVHNRVYPVILSGGVGSRLWPLSRELYPKQLIPLLTDRSILQETLARVPSSAEFEPPIIICNEEHRFIIAEQLRAMDIDPGAIVLEPVGRNTAPAVAIAAMLLERQDPGARMLVLPADHVILDVEAFHAAVRVANRAADDGALVTFGITPGHAETGYGYIRRGEGMAEDGCFRVDAFVEKPDRATAEAYVADGKYFWNSGMFLMGAQRYMDELARYQPLMRDAVAASIDAGRQDLDFFRLDRAAFTACPSDSIDYAVMERTSDAAVVPVDFSWSDIGSWPALWEISEQDENRNVTIGDVHLLDSHNSYVRSEGMLTAVLGLDDVIVVVSDDAVMIASRDHAQDVKKIVDRLKRDGRPEALVHRRVYRPWGYYQNLLDGDRFQVKRLHVEPGHKLSLQKHYHRAEHWVVVNGTARITRDGESSLLHENESTYIPIGMLHRLENPGRVPLTMIEVRSGPYLAEDDVVRLDDVYGRVE